MKRILKSIIPEPEEETNIPVVGVHNGKWSYYSEPYSTLSKSHKGIIEDRLHEIRHQQI